MSCNVPEVFGESLQKNIQIISQRNLMMKNDNCWTCLRDKEIKKEKNTVGVEKHNVSSFIPPMWEILNNTEYY